MTELNPCPREAEVARLPAGDLDTALREHLAVCNGCRSHAEQNQNLSKLGKELAWDEPAAERVEQLRTGLLAEAPRRTASPKPSRRPSRRSLLVAGLSVAAALLLWLGLRSQPPQATNLVPRVTLHPAAGARFSDLNTSADRIVRLTDGSLLVDVEKLDTEQRVRVVTGDAEVEVRGTSFDVAAVGDQLKSVWVLHGKVEVRVRGKKAILLAQGDRWRAAEPRLGLGSTSEGPVQGANDKVMQEPLPSARAEVAPAAKASSQTPRGSKVRAAGAAARGPVTNLKAEEPSEAAFREGWKALKSGDTKAAERAFGRASQVSSSSVSEDARFWRAVALSRAGDNPQAIAAFREFLAKHPQSSRRGEASTLLGRLLLASGQTAAARERFSDAKNDPRPEVKRAAESGLSESKPDDSKQ